MEAVFDLSSRTAPVSVLQHLLDANEERLVIANLDMDGLLAAQMLTSVSGWPTVALVGQRGVVWLRPDFASLDEVYDTGRAFTVDVFSLRAPGVSNHPAMWRQSSRGGNRQVLDLFDAAVQMRARAVGQINLSVAAGVGALRDNAVAWGLPYKYPLGSSQLLLAALEATGHAPRFYDRQILPWLIADADGGLDTIRNYSWNAELWWSALAAVVGPASLSEFVFRVATEQRPNEQKDVDRRLRWEHAQADHVWKPNWNLLSDDIGHAMRHVELVQAITGWPSPFHEGPGLPDTWQTTSVTTHRLSVKGIGAIDPGALTAKLDAAAKSAHLNFSTFEDTALSWWDGA